MRVVCRGSGENDTPSTKGILTARLVILTPRGDSIKQITAKRSALWG